MKKLQLIVLVFFITSITAFGQNIQVVPQPLLVEKGEGFFAVNSKTKIISEDDSVNNIVFLQQIFQPVFPKGLKIKRKGSNGIVVKINTNLSEKLGEEGYLLKVNEKGIAITGATKKGVFYAIQTLLQLLPVNLNTMNNEINIPFVSIEDRPRFSWRSFMLDEARYFKGKNEVKKILDEMALLKMNVFHWHLTDDQGWRIEIKKYPKLTSVGSYRKDSQIGGWDSEKRSGIPHKGYYTQEEIKEIIDYALERNITIVPEIEMPGHASAAIAAYPWLGTIGELKGVPVVFGKLEDSYNVSSPRVYKFIEEVLSEVIDLFPGNIIHIGGDEVKFGAWKTSKEVQDFMKLNQLQTPADLQIFFTNKISNFIESKNERMMGWNEVLGGNIHEWQKKEDVKVKEKLAKSTIIHFWKGNEDLIKETAISGYDIVNSNNAYTYMDYSYEYLNLKKAYEFEPIPKDLDMKYHSKIIGLGCQMWGEWIPDNQDMDKMVFPRLAAYAEVGWTINSRKDYSVFRSNMDAILGRWKNMGIQYYKEFE